MLLIPAPLPPTLILHVDSLKSAILQKHNLMAEEICADGLSVHLHRYRYIGATVDDMYTRLFLCLKEKGVLHHVHRINTFSAAL
jgi:hypothetical protein